MTVCPRCHRSEDMQPSQWGHPLILLCHNPPCIYARTLQAAGRIVPTAPLAEVVRLKASSAPAALPLVLPADVLCLAGGTKCRALIALLSDGIPRSADECRLAIGVRRQHMQTLVSRVRLRGFDVDTLRRLPHRPLSYQLLAVPSVFHMERKSA